MAAIRIITILSKDELRRIVECTASKLTMSRRQDYRPAVRHAPSDQNRYVAAIMP
jgi:hypothetical protein